MMKIALLLISIILIIMFTFMYCAIILSGKADFK